MGYDTLPDPLFSTLNSQGIWKEFLRYRIQQKSDGNHKSYNFIKSQKVNKGTTCQGFTQIESISFGEKKTWWNPGKSCQESKEVKPVQQHLSRVSPPGSGCFINPEVGFTPFAWLKTCSHGVRSSVLKIGKATSFFNGKATTQGAPSG